MASSPVLAGTPPLPPDVSSQMGGGSDSGLGEMLASKNRERQGQAPPQSMEQVNAANPQGAVLARIDAVEKVLEEVAKLNEGMAPFCSRAVEILKTGMGEALKSGKPGNTSAPASNVPPSPAEMGTFPGSV